MHIVAWDVSGSRTGWASWSEGQERPAYGSFPVTQGGVGDQYDALVNLHRKFLEVVALASPTRTVIEAPPDTRHWNRPTNHKNNMLLIRLAGHVGYLSRMVGCRNVREVEMRAWFVHFNQQGPTAKRPNGVSTKDITRATCRAADLTPQYDDECDAIGILTYEMSTIGIVAPWMAFRTPLLRVGER